MTWLIDWAVARGRTMVFILMASLVAGVASYVAIPKEADPDIPIPFIFVSLTLQGISPQDGERLLVRPMETELQSVEGLEEMRSYAAQGHAGIILEFDVNFDKDQALIDVREKVDTARAELPDDADEPVVTEFNTSTFPIMIVSLYGDAPERTLYRLAKRLQDRIEANAGVLEASMVGQREELLEVVIDPALMESYNINQTELINAVNRNNQLVAAGNVDTGQGRFSVKVPGLFETAEDVYNLVVKQSGEGTVTLGDIAQIRRTFQDPNGFAYFEGSPTIGLEITKRVGANIIETTEAVREIVEDESRFWDDGVKYAFTADISNWIYRSLGQLQASIITAISLVMIVVLAALGLRSAVLVGIAIPSSFLIGFLFMYTGGITLNFMVMFGLVLAVGILVDGAIVVTEYADRKMVEGLHRRQAYAMAAKRMFWPITSSTLTTLAAFVPMLFWPGVSGKFMSYLPITLIVVLSASLFVALIFLPVLGSIFGKTPTTNSATLRALAASETGDIRTLGGITGAYARFINRLIAMPTFVLAAVVMVCITIGFAYSYLSKGVEFFVETEPERIYVLVSARGNLSVMEARDLVLEVEKVIGDVNGIKTIFTRTQTAGGGGPGGGGGPAGALPADMIGQILLELKPWEARPGRPGKQILADLRAKTADLPGIRVEVREEQGGPPTGKDIQLEIKADDFGLLTATAAKINKHFQSMDGLIEVEDTRPLPGIEWELVVDRERAGRFGADIATIGATVQLVTNGILIGRYRPDDADDEVDIRARFPDQFRNIEQLDRLRVLTNQGLVPISNFVEREARPQVTQIDRVDARRIMTIRANTTDGVLPNDKIAEIREWLESEAGLDQRVTWTFRGADEEQQAAAEFLSIAALTSLFLMFVILLTQFNSFYHSFLILSSVVFSTFGVLLGMMVMGQTFSVIMTGTGIVALAGIVVNNNIVLIDTFQRLRKDGMETPEAVVRTAAQRLRPVFLTTVTTMCGLLPMMFALNVDYFSREVSIGGPVAVWWVQLATAVVFGLGFSTVLTLVLTPAMLALPWRWNAALRRQGTEALQIPTHDSGTGGGQSGGTPSTGTKSHQPAE